MSECSVFANAVIAAAAASRRDCDKVAGATFDILKILRDLIFESCCRDVEDEDTRFTVVERQVLYWGAQAALRDIIVIASVKG